MPYQIFLVEDHPFIREAYAAVLEAEPDLNLCGTAESAEEAVDMLDGLACDLVVTDFRLPGGSGIDLVRRLRAEHPALPTVVISAHQEGAFAREAKEAGAAAFLNKRDLIETLVPTIRAVLSGLRLDAA